jgi:hypothetical protein
MDKCREDLEAKFANSPELKDGHISWWDVSQSYIAKTEDFQESADYWNQILNAWRLRQPDIDLLEAKVEELQKQKSLQELEVNQIAQANQVWQSKCQELQKRVDAYSQIGLSLVQELREARQDPQSINDASDKQFYGSLDRIEQALKGEG